MRGASYTADPHGGKAHSCTLPTSSHTSAHPFSHSPSVPATAPSTSSSAWCLGTGPATAAAAVGHSPLAHTNTSNRPQTTSNTSDSQALLTTIPHHGSASLSPPPTKGRLKQRPWSSDEPCRLIPQLCATTQCSHSCGDRDITKQ